MPVNSHLVLAFFEDEAAADGAVGALQSWAKHNRRVQLDAVGVLVKEADGQVKTHKLGPTEGRKGVGIGAVLGVVAGIASGGLSVIAEGALIGGAGGGVLGSFFHKSLGLTDEDAARIASRLDAGHAAVGALVPEHQAPTIARELESFGGEPEVHDVTAAGAATTPVPGG